MTSLNRTEYSTLIATGKADVGGELTQCGDSDHLILFRIFVSSVRFCSPSVPGN